MSWGTAILYLLFSIAQVHSLTCYTPPRGTPLPITVHCRELANAIIYAGNLPEYRAPRSWGRGLQDNETATKIPKLYWLPGRGPSSCALQIDVQPPNVFAVEKFTLTDVGVAAAMIINFCLIENRKLGLESLGETKQVDAVMMRADGPMLPDKGFGETIYLGGSMGSLAFASLAPTNQTSFELLDGIAES